MQFSVIISDTGILRIDKCNGMDGLVVQYDCSVGLTFIFIECTRLVAGLNSCELMVGVPLS